MRGKQRQLQNKREKYFEANAKLHTQNKPGGKIMLQNLHIWITRRQSGGGGRLARCGSQESRRRSFQRLAIRARRRRRRSAKWAKEEMKLPFQDCIFFHFCVHTDRGAAGLPPPPAAATAAAAAAFACCTTAAAAAAAAATPPPPPTSEPPPPPGLGTDWPKPNAPGEKKKIYLSIY